MSELGEALAEAQQLERIEPEFAAHAARVNAEWARALAARKACSGWGGHWFGQSHPYGADSATEYLFDLCDALPPEVAIGADRSVSTPTIEAQANANIADGTNDGLLMT
jgi:hypothetical protein